jgi:hypothetical protein
MVFGGLRFISVRAVACRPFAIDGNGHFQHGPEGKSSEFGNHA